MKSTVACLLILALVIPAEARERTPLEQAQKITPGSMVIVTLQDKKTLRGRLKQVAQDRFTLEQPASGAWSSREMLFQDVRKIAEVKENSTVERVLDDVFMIPVAVIFYAGYTLYCVVFRRNCDYSP
jgi:hypothetical protein